MAFDPLGFIQVANRLASENPSEAELRTSVGRTYYALFLTARERLTQRGVRFQKRDIHKQVISQIRRRNTAVGDKLDSLRALRIEADYQLSPSRPNLANWDTNCQIATAIATEALPRIQGI